jgi:ABC-2 type transport system ATP-binding protein
MAETALKVNNISKTFSVPKERLHGSGNSFFKDVVSGFFHLPRKEFQALKDVSFNVEQGEALGIIGMNGAGKSTLLKILSDIIRPSSGTIEICGKLAAILDIGVGFNQELTGRDNISLYGKMLGFSRADITEKFDEIVAFSELHDFIDTPVKLYSSGMLMRLGFSVIASLDADIILLDEILAVGDVNFRNKCVNKIVDLKNQKKTILIVGHDLNEISNYCDKLILLHHGQLVASGTPTSIISRYEEILIQSRISEEISYAAHFRKKDLNQLFTQGSENLKTSIVYEENQRPVSPSFEVHSASISSASETQEESQGFNTDEALMIKITARYSGGKGDMAFVINDLMNNKIFGNFIFLGNKPKLSNDVIYEFCWTVPANIFNNGIFKIGLVLFDDEYKPLFTVPEMLIFSMTDKQKEASSFGFYTPVKPLLDFRFSPAK